MNIKIIYDKSDDRKRRTCFWKSVENRVHNAHNFEFISIADVLNLDEPEELFRLLDIFDKNKTDIIILNWDCVNTDPVYGSDRAFQFFEHYRHDLNIWVKTGGIVILEAQGAAWKPVQESYNIFSKNFPITTTEKRESGEIAKINKNLKNHPILNELNNEIELPSDGLFNQAWFPTECRICSTEPKKRRKLYQGWFEKYSKEWEPIVYAGAKGVKPIMLCRLIKTVTKSGDIRIGGYILTTMYIGASSLNKLVDNLLDFPNKVHNYHSNKKEEESKIIKKYLRITVLIILALILLWYFYPIIDQTPTQDFDFVIYTKSNFLALITVLCSIILVIAGPGIWDRRKTNK